jgi:hypothetical protein
MRLREFLGALALAACGAGGAGGDDTGAFVPSQQSCAALADQFESSAQMLDDACDTASDCTFVGGQVHDWTCDCAPTLPVVAVRRDVYLGSPVQDLADSWTLHCTDPDVTSSICDAAPPAITCVNHHCELAQRSCLGGLVDAGP